MHTKATLKADLARMGFKGTETILVHSSMKSIGEVGNRADGVLDALQEYFAEGLLVFPSMSYDLVHARQPVFAVRDTPCCVSLLPELFRRIAAAPDDKAVLLLAAHGCAGREILLDAYALLQGEVPGHIGDAEAALTDHTANQIMSGQHRAAGQGVLRLGCRARGSVEAAVRAHPARRIQFTHAGVAEIDLHPVTRHSNELRLFSLQARQDQSCDHKAGGRKDYQNTPAVQQVPGCVLIKGFRLVYNAHALLLQLEVQCVQIGA